MDKFSSSRYHCSKRSGIKTNTNMSSLLCLLITSFVILATVYVPVGSAKEFKVGDAEGWHEPGVNETAIYSHWAASNRFQVGDSLSFEYNNDSVLVVDKWGYYHCNTSKPITAFNNGRNVVKLDRPGPFYFISGAPNHCENGQQLLVDVISPHPISQSPPSIAVPPEPYLEVSPAPSPLSSSGVSVSLTVSSVLIVLIATFVTLVWSAP